MKAVEDREIETIIKRQEDIGLKAVTDGEFRRAFWNYDFLGALDGVEAYLGERKIKFQGPNPKPMMLRVTGKLGTFSGHPMLEHFKFVQSAHARDAEDDDPVAVKLAFPLRPRRRAGNRSTRRWTISTATSGRPTAKPCARLPTPAAAICSSTR